VSPELLLHCEDRIVQLQDYKWFASCIILPWGMEVSPRSGLQVQSWQSLPQTLGHGIGCLQLTAALIETQAEHAKKNIDHV
jgi:hypothetical protein